MISDPPPQPTGRLASSGLVSSGLALVTVGAMAANILAYLLHLLAGRWLLPAGYGEFASLLTAQLLLAVPALALQTVVARSTARGGGEAQSRALTYRTAGVVAVLAAALTPALAALFDTAALTAAAGLITAAVWKVFSVISKESKSPTRVTRQILRDC